MGTQTMIDLVVIADDITGSLDTGVQLAKTGSRVLASSTIDIDSIDTTGADVLVINTESRHLAPERASERVRLAVESVRRLGARHFYKKTDSALRGNVGAELAALLDATGRRALVFAPALPQAQRTTVSGRHLIGGVPLELTEFAADPLNPVRSSYLPELLGEQTDTPVVLATAEWIAVARPSIVVFDAQTQQDLERIASLARPHARSVTFAGCAGFASVLPSIIPLHRGRQAPPLPAVRGATLIACGSLHPASIEQLRRAQAHGVPTFVLRGSERSSQRAADGADASDPLLTEAVDALHSRRIAVICTSFGDEPRSPVRPDASPVRRLASLVRRIIRSTRVGALVVFGGDTLMEILRVIGVVGFEPIAEVTAGVPISIPLGSGGFGDSRDFIIVSKSGAFGDDRVIETIVRCVDGLKVE